MSANSLTRRVANPMATLPLASQFAMVAGFAGLAALAAQVKVPLPFTPVPVTLQVLVVLAAGYLLRPSAAAASMGLYLSLGAAGAPFFSGGGAGMGVLSGVTGGYLLAYPAAAWLVSILTWRGGGALRRLGAGMAALALVHLAGGLWLAMVTATRDAGLVLTLSLLPFLAVDLAKLAVAEWLTRPRSAGR